MGLITYVMLLFGITIALWLAGFQSPLFSMMQCPVGAASCTTQVDWVTTVTNSLIGAVTNPAVLIAIPVALFMSFILGGSFALMYVIPLLIGMVFLNIFLIPTQYVLTTAMPWEISLIIGGFLNLLLMMVIISFVRGGE